VHSDVQIVKSVISGVKELSYDATIAKHGGCHPDSDTAENPETCGSLALFGKLGIRRNFFGKPVLEFLTGTKRLGFYRQAGSNKKGRTDLDRPFSFSRACKTLEEMENRHR